MTPVRRRDAESRFDEEIRLRIELETERLVREAELDPNEARRRAFVAFGGVQKHKESLRDGRGVFVARWDDAGPQAGSSDAAKYRGLT